MISRLNIVHNFLSIIVNPFLAIPFPNISFYLSCIKNPNAKPAATLIPKTHPLKRPELRGPLQAVTPASVHALPIATRILLNHADPQPAGLLAHQHGAQAVGQGAPGLYEAVEILEHTGRVGWQGWQGCGWAPQAVD